MATRTINISLTHAFTLFSSSALLLSTLGLAGAKAQTPTATDSLTQPPTEAQLLAQQQVVPSLDTRLPVRASLGSIGTDSISVTLTNNSPDVLTYQSKTIPTDTFELMPGEQQTFDDISAPFTLVFYQKDGDLISADITDVNSQEDSFAVEFNGASTMAEDDRTVVLLPSGNIYVY